MKVAEKLPELQNEIADILHVIGTENMYVPVAFYNWLFNSEEAYNILILCIGFIKYPEFALFIYENFKNRNK